MKTTQVESLQQLDRRARCKLILENLAEHPEGLTARELADELGFTDRNSTAPRLTEMEKSGRVQTNGTRYDAKSNRNTTVYILTKEEQLCVNS